jgi:hypothetical protein
MSYSWWTSFKGATYEEEVRKEQSLLHAPYLVNRGAIYRIHCCSKVPYSEKEISTLLAIFSLSFTMPVFGT